MISNWLAATLSRRNIHYGWVMVGVTFLAALISAGTVGAPGVFIVPLQKEFGWSTAEISSALSIRFILFGLMAPFAAALLNRYGLRNVTLTAQLIVVSALVASLGMPKMPVISVGGSSSEVTMESVWRWRLLSSSFLKRSSSSSRRLRSLSSTMS